MELAFATAEGTIGCSMTLVCRVGLVSVDALTASSHKDSTVHLEGAKTVPFPRV
jgi:hypothetical protein